MACAMPTAIPPPTPIPTFDVNLIPTMVVQTAQAIALSATAMDPSTEISKMVFLPTYALVDAITLSPPAVNPPAGIITLAAYTLTPPVMRHVPIVFTATITPTAEPTSTAVKNTCAKTNYSFELRVMELINVERVNAGLHPLSYQPQLGAAARLYSADMACHNYLSHVGRDGLHFAERVERQGYQFEFGGENLGGGYAMPEEVVKGWMNSPSHKANLLGENYTEMGVGYAYYSKSDYVAYWTAEFGSPK